MTKAQQYAELRVKAEQLQSEIRTLEPLVLEELGESKEVETTWGKVAKYNRYTYTYSDTLKEMEAGAKKAIKDFTDEIMAEVKERKEAEEGSQTPQVSTGLRFTAIKPEEME
jgi:hypothetical protein